MEKDGKRRTRENKKSFKVTRLNNNVDLKRDAVVVVVRWLFTEGRTEECVGFKDILRIFLNDGLRAIELE
jgi:hypothetical protein